LSLSNLGKAGVGGILHNSSGLWVFDFSLNLGIATNNIAELYIGYSIGTIVRMEFGI